MGAEDAWISRAGWGVSGCGLAHLFRAEPAILTAERDPGEGRGDLKTRISPGEIVMCYGFAVLLSLGFHVCLKMGVDSFVCGSYKPLINDGLWPRTSGGRFVSKTSHTT